MSRVHFRYKQIGAGKITDFNATLNLQRDPRWPYYLRLHVFNTCIHLLKTTCAAETTLNTNPHQELFCPKLSSPIYTL